ncbi:hypothetical protein K474DRAFT_1679497 [Panus rudis PR-1116 ss-1]|nr:hypothetical protein K474DRAFT_1679497 [Panus rudis PR-1116 ss-1]
MEGNLQLGTPQSFENPKGQGDSKYLFIGLLDEIKERDASQAITGTEVIELYNLKLGIGLWVDVFKKNWVGRAETATATMVQFNGNVDFLETREEDVILFPVCERYVLNTRNAITMNGGDLLRLPHISNRYVMFMLVVKMIALVPAIMRIIQRPPHGAQSRIEPMRSYVRDVYKLEHHTQLPLEKKHGNIYLVIFERNTAYNQKLYEESSQLPAPGPDDAVNAKNNWLLLCSGDRVMARYNDSKDDTEDMEIIHVGRMSLCDPTMVNNFRNQCEHMAGKEHERIIPDEAAIKSGKAKGVPFEAIACNDAGQGGRCYNVGISVQPHPQITTPPASAKLARPKRPGESPHSSREEEQAETLRLTERFKAIHHATRLVVSFFQHVTEKVRHYQQTVHEYANCLRLGCHENCYSPAMQWNVLSASRVGDPNISLPERFGGPHRDCHDADGCLSCFLWFTSLAKSPSSYHPGLFYFPSLRMYVRLDDVGILAFQGCLPHCGIPPLCTDPDSTLPLDPSVTRMSCIAYPPSRYIEGQTRIAIAPVNTYKEKKVATTGGADMFYQTPEHLGTTYNNSIPISNKMSSAIDGVGIAEGISIANQIFRADARKMTEDLSLLPKSVGVEVNFDLLRKAVTVRGPDGQPIPMDPWQFSSTLPIPEPNACARYLPGKSPQISSKYTEDANAIRIVCDDSELTALAAHCKLYAQFNTLERKEALYLRPLPSASSQSGGTFLDGDSQAPSDRDVSAERVQPVHEEGFSPEGNEDSTTEMSRTEDRVGQEKSSHEPNTDLHETNEEPTVMELGQVQGESQTPVPDDTGECDETAHRRQRSSVYVDVPTSRFRMRAPPTSTPAINNNPAASIGPPPPYSVMPVSSPLARGSGSTSSDESSTSSSSSDDASSSHICSNRSSPRPAAPTARSRSSSQSSYSPSSRSSSPIPLHFATEISHAVDSTTRRPEKRGRSKDGEDFVNDELIAAANCGPRQSKRLRKAFSDDELSDVDQLHESSVPPEDANQPRDSSVSPNPVNQPLPESSLVPLDDVDQLRESSLPPDNADMTLVAPSSIAVTQLVQNKGKRHVGDYPDSASMVGEDHKEDGLSIRSPEPTPLPFSASDMNETISPLTQLEQKVAQDHKMQSITEQLRVSAEGIVEGTPSPQLASLQDLHAFIQNSDTRFSIAAVTCVPRIWSTLNSIKVSSARRRLETRRNEYLELSGYLQLWSWLQDISRYGVEKLDAHGQATEGTWIAKLAAKVYQHHFARTPIELRAQDYLDGWQPLLYEENPSRKLLSTQEVRSKTLETLQHVLALWLDFCPTKEFSQSYARFHLLAALVDNTHPNILLLESVVKAFRGILTHLLSPRCLKYIRLEHIQEFTDMLTRHPIALPDTPHRRMLATLGDLCLHESGHSQSLTPQSVNPPLTIQHQHIPRFLELAGLWLLDASSILPDSLVSKLRIGFDHLPFRESVPPRTSFLFEKNPPIDLLQLRTRSGLFSLLVWRIITYGTKSVDDGLVAYHNLSHWTETVQSSSTVSHYLFLPDAYGAGLDDSRQSGVQNAGALWDATAGWEEFLQSRDRISLQDLFNFLIEQECHCLDVYFCYTIAADCVYAGLVDDPSPKEVGYMVWKLQSHSFLCLQRLGLLSSELCSVDEVVQRFTELYNVAELHLQKVEVPTFNESLATIFDFNPIMLEFAMQKFVVLDIQYQDLF